MCIPGFIQTRCNYDAGITGDIAFFHEATIKEKTHALNYIHKKYGYLFLHMIKKEYEMNDLYVGVILRDNGTVESIMGGSGE